jgi:hypothetical protein
MDLMLFSTTKIQNFEKLLIAHTLIGYFFDFVSLISHKGTSLSVFRGFPLKLHQFATSRLLMSTMEELSAETPFIKD